MASRQDAAPHCFENSPLLKSVVSFHPVENWRSRLPIRGWVAIVARVWAAAELTVETIEVERQSSDSVTDCQVFSAASSMESMRDCMWSQVPGAGAGILESWLLAAAIMHERASCRLGVVERGCMEERG